MLEAIVPVAADYKHHLRGYDNNGAAHIRTALLNVSVTITIQHSNLLMGAFQEIKVIDMDPGHKIRNVVVQVIGE